jgi:hypothetical protein
MTATRAKAPRLINPEWRPAMLGKLDRRTWQGRLLRDVRLELAEHVGGHPSAAQLALIEQVAQIRLRLAMFDRKHAERGRMSAHDGRTYLAWANSYSRMLLALGLERHQPAAAAKPPSLAEILAEQDYRTAAWASKATETDPGCAPILEASGDA